MSASNREEEPLGGDSIRTDGTSATAVASEQAQPGGRGMRGPTGASGGIGLHTLRSPVALKHTFSSLSIPAFRNLWIGMLLQMGAMQMQMLARGYYIYEITRSPSLLGVVTAVTAIPALAFGLYGGVFADRLNKKKIIQAGQLVSMLLVLFIGVSISTQTIVWQHFLLASIVQGAVMPLVMPARQTIIPQLVGEKRMMNAVALNSMVMSITTLVAPATAGILIAGLGIAGVYYLMAGMYVGAIFFTALLPNLVNGDNQQRDKPMFSDLLDGIRYVRKEKAILLLLLLTLSTMLLAQPLRFILPIFARDVFEVGSEGLGWMMSAMGIGSLMGALFIASLRRAAGRGILLIGTGIISGGALLGFASMSYLAPVFLMALPLMTFIGVFQSGRMTLGNSLLMEYSAPQYRGRAMSIFMVFMMMMPAAVLPITIVIESIGAPLTLGIMASLLILVSGAILMTSSRLRALQ